MVIFLDFVASNYSLRANNPFYFWLREETKIEIEKRGL
jgi:hypothetical protein